MQPTAPSATTTRHAVAGIALAVVLSACSDTIPTPPGASLQPATGATQQAQGPRIGPSRIDTPWRYMTDVELSAKVAEAGGRVFIGFKDGDAAAGVDEFGRVLARPSSVATAKAHLRSLGLDFEIEFVNMPSVVTRVPANIVTELRHNPLIGIDPISWTPHSL